MSEGLVAPSQNTVSDGADGPGDVVFELRDVPPGLYEITATLVGSNGRLAQATQLVKVVPSPGHSE